MNVLGIESSCDETACAIVKDGTKVLSNVVYTQIKLHQPWGGAEGKASDIEITAREILRLKERLNHILADHSGKSYEDVVRDTDRDYFMSASEAAEYGLIDGVVSPKNR